MSDVLTAFSDSITEFATARGLDPLLLARSVATMICSSVVSGALDLAAAEQFSLIVNSKIDAERDRAYTKRDEISRRRDAEENLQMAVFSALAAQPVMESVAFASEQMES